MSTVFAIIKQELLSKTSQEKDFLDIKSEDCIEIAFRSNRGNIYWCNRFHILLDYLPEDTKVFALDNSAQGIYTISDLKKEFNEI